MSKKNDWTDKLRDQLAGYQEPVGDDLWMGIEQSLAHAEPSTPQETVPNDASTPTAARRISLWRRFSIAAGIAAVVVGGTYIYLSQSEMEQMPQMVNESNGMLSIFDKSEMVALESRPNNVVNQTNRKLSVRHGKKMETTALMDGNEASIQAENVSSATENRQEDGAMEQEVCEEKSMPRLGNARAKKTVQRSLQVEEPQAELAMGGDAHRHAVWSVSVYGGNGLVGNQSVMGLNPMVSELALKSTGGEYNAPVAVEEFSSVAVLGSYYAENYKEEKHHHQPVSIGVQVGVPLLPRLTLTTGVAYTWTSSDFYVVQGGSRMATSQVLHYVGVPLGINYEFWGTRRWHTYLTMGGEADFNVKNHTETGGERVEDAKRDRTQWSAQAALGVQYDLAPQIGVYLEPGGKYYFDNGSGVENIFKQKKLNFNLQLGLRWNLGQ